MRAATQTGLSVRKDPLPYAERLDERPIGSVDLVVIHCTELPDLAMAREYGERICHTQTGTGNSGHFYIDRDGLAAEWVPLTRVAHHVRAYNERSIGIELVNRGRWPDWLHSDRQVMTEAYPAEQVAALGQLLAWLRRELPGLRWIAGHEDLDTGKVPASDNALLRVFRKRDPGPMFPWNRALRSSGLERLRG